MHAVFRTGEEGNMLLTLIPVETELAINWHWIWYLIVLYFFNNFCALVTEVWQNGAHIVLHVIDIIIYGVLMSCNLVQCTKFGNSTFCQFGSIISNDISSRALSFFFPVLQMTNTSINGEKGQKNKSDHGKQKTQR